MPTSLDQNDWIADRSDTSTSSQIDENGIRFTYLPGLPQESVPATPWVASISADILRSDISFSPTANAGSHTLGGCTALLIQPDLMPDPVRDFASLALRPKTQLGSLRRAVVELFDIQQQQHPRLHEHHQGWGIWGSDCDDSWLLIFERFWIAEDGPRRRGWGTRLAARVLAGVTERAREAGTAVLVLVMPSYPEKELEARTVGFTAAEKQKWREEGKRAAMGFWRSLGLVRMGETLCFWLGEGAVA